MCVWVSMSALRLRESSFPFCRVWLWHTTRQQYLGCGCALAFQADKSSSRHSSPPRFPADRYHNDDHTSRACVRVWLSLPEWRWARSWSCHSTPPWRPGARPAAGCTPVAPSPEGCSGKCSVHYIHDTCQFRTLRGLWHFWHLVLMRVEACVCLVSYWRNRSRQGPLRRQAGPLASCIERRELGVGAPIFSQKNNCKYGRKHDLF